MYRRALIALVAMFMLSFGSAASAQNQGATCDGKPFLTYLSPPLGLGDKPLLSLDLVVHSHVCRYGRAGESGGGKFAIYLHSPLYIGSAMFPSREEANKYWKAIQRLSRTLTAEEFYAPPLDVASRAALENEIGIYIRGGALGKEEINYLYAALKGAGVLVKERR